MSLFALVMAISCAEPCEEALPVGTGDLDVPARPERTGAAQVVEYTPTFVHFHSAEAVDELTARLPDTRVPLFVPAPETDVTVGRWVFHDEGFDAVVLDSDGGLLLASRTLSNLPDEVVADENGEYCTLSRGGFAQRAAVVFATDLGPLLIKPGEEAVIEQGGLPFVAQVMQAYIVRDSDLHQTANTLLRRLRE